MANNVPAVKKRIAAFFMLILGLLVILLGRIAWVQFVEGTSLTTKAQNQLRDNKVLQSPRGTIYDRNGRELAISSLTKSLYANPKIFNGDADTVASLLAPILELSADDIKESLLADRSFIWLKRTLEPEKTAQVVELIKQYDLKGLEFVEESKRYYPNDTLAAHVLGFVGTDDVALGGVEKTLDKEIKGELIKQQVETDSYGKPIFKSIFSFPLKKQAKSVYLTLDSTIQFLAEQAADKAMTTTGAKGATVILMNPRTGEILGMASRPTYNPNQFYRYNENQRKNRAISVVYEPGSTFKSVVAAAALQEGLVTPDERFHDVGFVQVSGQRIQNWNGEALGTITFTDILKNSINTGFVQVGLRLGANKLIDYAKAFGFGKDTDVELPGEEAGILFDPKEMRDSDIATMSIGQSVAVTPLQLITAVSAIANDGVLLKPHIIKEIHNADGSVSSVTTTQSVRQVITQETAHKLQLLMEKVITEGGGQKGAVKGYRFAGKTGTAQKLRESGVGYESSQYIASFIGYGPLEDAQIIALVVIDAPMGVYYGGQVAAPIFSELMTQVVRYLNIMPEGLSQLPVTKKTTTPAERQTVMPVVPPGKVLVPNIIGKSVREAGDALNNLGLAFIPVGTGQATSQSLPPYTVVEPGSEVTVHFEP